MHIMKVKNMISKISFNVPKINFLGAKAVNKNTLERSPKNDEVNFSGVNLPVLDSDLKSLLDNSVFTFQKYNGKEFQGTIKEYFENSVIRYENMGRLGSLIHCTQTKDIADDIIKNGLDWTKTSRLKCGPGTYFSQSSVGGSEQGAGSVPIAAFYKGKKDKYPIFEPCFYEAVIYNKELMDKLDGICGNDKTKVINRYCHDLLQDEMGIDVLYASSGRSAGAFAVLNNDCMSLRRYGW